MTDQLSQQIQRVQQIQVKSRYVLCTYHPGAHHCNHTTDALHHVLNLPRPELAPTRPAGRILRSEEGDPGVVVVLEGTEADREELLSRHGVGVAHKHGCLPDLSLATDALGCDLVYVGAGELLLLRESCIRGLSSSSFCIFRMIPAAVFLRGSNHSKRIFTCRVFSH